MTDIPEALQQHLLTYRKQRNFDPKEKTDDIIEKLTNYMKKCSLTGCVISVSGGVDSAVTYKLAKIAQKKHPDIIKRVLPIAQPIHSSDWALNRGRELCRTCNENIVIIDSTDIFDQWVTKIEDAIGIKGNDFVKGQMRSYMRTPVGYMGTQLLSQEGFPAIVLGTGNMDEDGYLKYFCKPGDGTVDVQFIHDCHKSEVFQLAKYNKIPKSILEAKPSADLWDGQEDEEEIGASYDFIELFTGYYLPMSEEEKTQFTDSLSEEDREWFREKAELCAAIHRRNSHKKSCAINL